MWSPANLRHAALTLVVVGVPLVASIIAVGFGLRLLDDEPLWAAVIGVAVGGVGFGLGRRVWRAIGLAVPLDAPDWDAFERLRSEWETRPS